MRLVFFFFFYVLSLFYFLPFFPSSPPSSIFFLNALAMFALRAFGCPSFLGAAKHTHPSPSFTTPFAPPLQLRTISDQWPVFLFVDFKVTCCLFSYVGVHTRRQHTHINTHTHESAGARARECVCSPASAPVYRNARGQSNPPTCVEDATCTRGIVYVASDR